MNKLAIATISGFLSLSASTSFAGDPKASPDVVGRNLSIWGLGSIGHVGMWSGSNVVEVLNKATVIQSNSLSSFKASDKVYWGAKYGVGASNGAKIISSGWDQRNYSPSYTTTAYWQQGGVAQKVCTQYGKNGSCVRWTTSLSTAVFRCDTFVDFSFWKGNGSRLVAGGSILPFIVYNSMPKTR